VCGIPCCQSKLSWTSQTGCFYYSSYMGVTVKFTSFSLLTASVSISIFILFLINSLFSLFLIKMFNVVSHSPLEVYPTMTNSTFERFRFRYKNTLSFFSYIFGGNLDPPIPLLLLKYCYKCIYSRIKVF